MSALHLDAGLEQVLAEAEQVLGGRQFASEYLKQIRRAYRPGETMAGAFGELLTELLAPWDVLLTDAADPALKRASAPVLRRALTEAEREEAVLAERARELEAAGYGVQVPVLARATNLFRTGEAGRERLYRVSDGFAGAESGERWTEPELLGELEREPGRFSPNVLLRPVVESAVFPTLAYVGGPGEMRYFGQLEPLFRRHGILPPTVVPRFSATLVEPRWAEDLRALGLDAADLARPRHELMQQLARRALPDAVERRLAALREAIAGEYRALIDAAAEVDPTLSGPLGSLRNRALADAGTAERKVLAHLKRSAAVRTEQLDRLLDALHPTGAPQERVLNALPFLARHGRALLADVYEQIRFDALRANDES